MVKDRLRGAPKAILILMSRRGREAAGAATSKGWFVCSQPSTRNEILGIGQRGKVIERQITRLPFGPSNNQSIVRSEAFSGLSPSDALPSCRERPSTRSAAAASRLRTSLRSLSRSRHLRGLIDKQTAPALGVQLFYPAFSFLGENR